MSLFEIDLNSNFKFTNNSPYLSQHDFQNYFKYNNLNNTFQVDEYLERILDDHFFSINQNSVMARRLRRIRNNHDLLRELIHTNIVNSYNQHFGSNSPTELSTKLFGCEQDHNVYPNWQLFYIGIEKQSFVDYEQTQFKEHLGSFVLISEIIYKEYLIRNIGLDLRFENPESESEYRSALHESLSTYIRDAVSDSTLLLDFLKYLLHLHYLFRENEQYKLMWNLESSYILTCLRILLNEFELSYTSIVDQMNENRRGNQRSDLNSIYIDPSSYLISKEPYYANQNCVDLINEVMGSSIDKATLSTVLQTDEMYRDVLLSIIELNQRFFANKRSENTVMSITRGIVLNIEETIKQQLALNSEMRLFDCLKQITPGSHLLKPLRNQIGENDSGDVFFEKFETLITTETNSLEKVLMIYYHARNYVAHNIINIDRLFYDNERMIIRNILDAITVILYVLALRKAAVDESSE